MGYLVKYTSDANGTVTDNKAAGSSTTVYKIYQGGKLDICVLYQLRGAIGEYSMVDL
jgi:hypothetical protein